MFTNLFKKKYKFNFDKNNPEFVVFDYLLYDNDFIKKAKTQSGCIIESIDKNFNFMVCTGDGFESFQICNNCIKNMFKTLLSKNKNINFNQLVNRNYWDLQIFYKAW